MSTATSGTSAVGQTMERAAQTAGLPALAIEPANLNSHELKQVSFEIVEFQKNLKNEMKNLNRAMNQAILQGDSNLMKACADKIVALVTNAQDPKTGVIARGRSFVVGTTDKNQPATSINLRISVEDAKTGRTQVLEGNIVRIVDSFTGNQEAKIYRLGIEKAFADARR